jgi:hypothetical protein
MILVFLIGMILSKLLLIVSEFTPVELRLALTSKRSKIPELPSRNLRLSNLQSFVTSVCSGSI